jgi:hypothetical protein
VRKKRKRIENGAGLRESTVFSAIPVENCRSGGPKKLKKSQNG